MKKIALILAALTVLLFLAGIASAQEITTDITSDCTDCMDPSMPSDPMVAQLLNNPEALLFGDAGFDTESTTIPKPICVDSDVDTEHPDGINPDVKGTVTYSVFLHGNWVNVYFHDYCPGCFWEGNVVEYYCEYNSRWDLWIPKFTKIECAEGCEDGHCTDGEIPEFGLIAGGIAVVGALGAFLVLRKRK